MKLWEEKQMDLRYPIGKFTYTGEGTAEQRQMWIQDIRELPSKLREAVHGLSEEQLALPYREGGWSVTQVVHHLADSHMNSLIRFKLALTEEKPTIKTYYEERWANLEDAISPDIDMSIKLLEALHARWVILLETMEEKDYQKEFVHPEIGRSLNLDFTLGLYAWHGKHHVAHITALRNRLNL